MTVFLITAAILGSVIGSFLNVVVLRYNTGRGFGGRSSCASCARTLRWFELIPILSFLAQKGRCTACGSKISWQYPLVEIVTAGLFLASAYHAISSGDFTALHFVHLALMVSVLVALSVYDIHHTILPNGMVASFAVLAFAYAFAPYGVFPNPSLVRVLIAGLIAAAPFALLWGISGGRWMGFGDAKLALGIGFALGAFGSISAIVWAFWVGAAVSIALMFYARFRLPGRARRFTMKSEVPFGPFLCVGFLIVLFCSYDILTLVDAISF